MSIVDTHHTENPALRAEIDGLSDKELKLLEWSLEWREVARPKQLAPLGPWNNWGILSGRGFGKTLTGSHWIVETAGTQPGSFNGIIAPSLSDVRHTLLEGPTGLITLTPPELLDDYHVSDHLVTMFNGAKIRGFSSETPSKLRGPQHHNCWGDETASWENPIDTLDMMRFGLRLGSHPRFLWTTTPKTNKIIKRLMAAKHSVIVRGSSYENRTNLSDVYWEEIAQYEGTKLGRQELHGEILEAEDDGIIPNSQIKLWPANKPLPTLRFVIASLDTAFTERTADKKTHHPDQSVMQVWGVFVIGREYHVMLLDAWRDFLSFPQLLARVKKEIKTTYGATDEPMFRPLILPKGPPIGHQGKPIDLTIIEDKGSGISLRQQLASENILTHPYNPGREDKLMRLHLVSPLFAHGRVWMVESNVHPGKVRNWAEPVREALCTFRGSGSIEYDDDVDAATQALRYVKDNFMKSLTSEKGSHVVDSDNTRVSSRAQQQVGTNPYAE